MDFDYSLCRDPGGAVNQNSRDRGEGRIFEDMDQPGSGPHSKMYALVACPSSTGCRWITFAFMCFTGLPQQVRGVREHE